MPDKWDSGYEIITEEDLKAKSNANDCHDEEGRFCEGGSSGGSTSSERIDPRSRFGYSNDALRRMTPRERQDVDYGRKMSGEQPIDWRRVDALSASSAKRTGGIGPQASVYSAEKRGKEYGYAKKVSFYQCTSVDQANEINAQMAELSDDSGLVLGRVYVYKEKGSKEAPSNANAYHQGSVNTIGFRNGVTAQYCAKNAPYPPGQQEENAKWFFDYADRMEREHETGEREKADPEIVRAFRKQGEEALRFKDYSAFTVPGNGARNPVVDHEFAHALVTRASDAGFMSEIEGKDRFYVADRVERFALRCRESAEITKFSVYAVTGTNVGRVEHGEAIAETYAYWKSGGLVPDDIAKGLRRLETYRGPGTGT